MALNGNLSSWVSVNSVAPQGSVLGPLLFICYVNDIPEVVICTLKMFAVDTKILFQVDSNEDREKLQSDLMNLKEWADTWQLRFSVEKCEVMHLTRKSGNIILT